MQTANLSALSVSKSISLTMDVCPLNLSVMKGKVVVITGAGRGIGKAVALAFAKKGCKVVVAARTASEIEATAADVLRLGTNALALTCDVSSEASVVSLFKKTVAEFGHVDVLVNNAGTFARAEMIDQDLGEWEKVFAVNVRGMFLCSREFLKGCRQTRKGGSIVNISSLAGVRGTDKFAGFGAYVASKFAVVGFTESLAVEGKPLAVRANCIAPGAVDTQMLREAAPQLKTETTPEMIAKTIVHLADDEQSGHLNGSLIEVFSNL